jgi:hypothetical protein
MWETIRVFSQPASLSLGTFVTTLQLPFSENGVLSFMIKIR